MTYATWNPADKSARITLSGGDLVATADNSGNNQAVRGSTSASAGKKYFELTVTDNSSGNNNRIGLANATYNVSGANALGGDANGWAYARSGFSVLAGSGSPYGAAWTTGDVIGVLWDADAGDLIFWKNGISQGTAMTGLTGTLYPAISFAGGAEAFTANFGGSAFTYAPPAGYTGWSSSSNDVSATLPMLTASAYGLVTGVYLQPLPMFTIDASGGVTGVYLQPLPMFTVAATGFTSVFGGAAVTLPMLTIGAAGASVLVTADLILPLKQLSGTGFTGPAGSLSLSLPLFTIIAGSAPEATLTLPSLVIDATGKAGFVGMLSQIFPALRLTGEILPAGFGSGSPALPLFSISASGLVDGIASAAFSFRSLQLTSTGFAGTVSTLASSLPLPTIALLGYGSYTLTASLRLPALITSDGVLVPTTAQTFRTWVLNTRKGGLTEYDFEFNSYATFRGIVLAADATGLFKLDGADADGTAPIIAVVRTGEDDFGTSMNKRVPRIYVGVQSREDLEFSTITTSGGKRTYLLAGNDVTGIQQRRVPIGRGPKSPYWQFELTNPRGEDFLLEHFTLRPEKSVRRVI